MQGQRGGRAPGARAGREGQGGGAAKGCRGCSEAEGIGTGSVKEKSKGRAGGRSEWRPERRSPVSNSLSFMIFLLISWQVRLLCKAQGQV